MLTPELVHVRRKGELLSIVQLSAAQRAEAVLIAESLLQAAQDSVSETRADLEARFANLEFGPKARKLAAGLTKLVEDACEFQAPSSADAAALRSEVFMRAATARRNAEFVREHVLDAAAGALGIAASDVEAGLFGDLRSAERLMKAPSLSAAELLQRYDVAQIQAILLRAVKVTVDIECATADAYRALFNKLKFRQLMYRITARSTGGYTIEIDGPYSLFDAVTKYGLELALVLPSLMCARKLKLTAELRWGKRRDPLKFELRHETQEKPLTEGVRDEVKALWQAFRELGSSYDCELAQDLLDLPGVGLCVPDLIFTDTGTGECLYLEVLGFWSRDAVWRRVDLVERGLAAKLIFAVSSRLRVSEEVLDEAMSSALYVYKGRMSARSVLKQLDALRERKTRTNHGHLRTTSAG
jgi:predicted nuclease of restriction endonuclease-like RecB superfamily